MDFLPFEPNVVAAHQHADLTQCGMYRLLPQVQREFVQKKENRHVLDYLHMLPLETIGMPDFYPELSRNLKDIKKPNLIYPVGDEKSIHILSDENDIRNYYIPIEPILFKEMDDLLYKVEDALVNVVNVLDINTTDLLEKKALLNDAIDQVCVISENKTEKTGLNKYFERTVKLFRYNDNKKIELTLEEFNAVKYILFRDKIGMGILEPLIKDPYIEDISCSGVGNIFIEHKIFSGLKTSTSFKNMDELDSFVIKISEKVGKPVTYRDPIIDAALPDGSRINMVYGKDVSKRGSNFTIRKFAGTPPSILELIQFGSLDYTIAAYLWILLKEGMNCFIAGETASGKTTLLNALTTFLRPNAKVVSIEDTPELQIPLKNWTREVTRTSREDSNSDVTMFDLLRAALRQRPDEILIGEIRGVEGNVAFQAMQTGHPVMSTFHASTVEKLIQRLTGNPISVPKTYIDNLNLAVIQQAIHLPGKGMVRRITSINEIVGYDPSTESFTFIETFRWDPAKDIFEFTGNFNSYLLENKIAPKLGIPESKRKIIYKELQRRARLLEKINDGGVTGFYELFNMMMRVEEEGII